MKAMSLSTFWHRRVSAPLLLLILWSCPAVFGQATFTAQLRGEVRDPTGAIVPGAKVTITNDATQVADTQSTGAAGRYIFTSLRPATYTVTVQASGFKTLLRGNVELRVAQQTDLDLTLEVGDLSTKVQVEGTAPLLNSVSASLGQEVDNRYVTTVPLLNRSINNLFYLTPGVTQSNGGQSGALILISNGQRSSTAEVRVDGANTSYPEYSEGANLILGYTPPIENIQEFKMQNNSFSAEYGNNGGTVINMVTKSGANALHGSGYWFSQRPALNANNFFNNRAGKGKPDFLRDQYGGSIGGPIRKNRTFFFFDYDRVRNNQPQTTVTTVPTALQRSGNFSQTVNANGSLRAIFDPNSTTRSGSDYLREPFPGNLIPASLRDPVAMKILGYYPSPTDDGDPVTHLNNFTAAGVFVNPLYTLDIKIDHQISDNQRLSGRYSRNKDHRESARFYNTEGDTSFVTNVRPQTGYGEHSWTMNPNTVWTNRLGIIRVSRRTGGKQFDFRTLGFPNDLAAGGGSEFPPISVSGYASLGISAWTDELLGATQYQFSSAMNKIVGAHNLRFGGEQRIYFTNYWQPGAPNGSFSFGRGQTTQSVFNPSSSQGDALASLMLGWGSGGSLNILPGSVGKSKETAVFVQDDWRVSDRLTLNLGLRYEWSTPYTDRYNRIQIADPFFDTGVDVPGLGRIRGGDVFVTPDHRSLGPDRNNFAPRLGAAYRLSQSTVLRSGAGIYYGINPYSGTTFLGPSFSSAPPWLTSLDGGITRYGTLSNPYPLGVTLPPGTKYGKLANWGFGAGGSMDTEMRNAEIYQWNAGIQHQLGKTVLVDVAYSGMRSTHLLWSGMDNFNFVGRADREQYGNAGLNQLVPNPFRYLFAGPNAVFKEPTSIYNNATIPRINLLRPFPQFDGALKGNPRPMAVARYNALFLRFEKRYSRGLNLLGAYTFSRTMENAGAGRNTRYGNAAALQDRTDLRSEYGLGGSDTPHRLVVGGSYELPIGRGKALGRNWGRAMSGVIGGWQVNTFVTFQSGQPLNFSNAFAQLADGAQRPNINANPRSSFSIPEVADRKGIYFDPSAFSAPPPQIPGNAPRYVGEARASGIRNIDFSLFKNIEIREHMKLELRAEFFNFTNTPRFGNPNTSFGNTAFGTISSQSNSPRQSQMGARLVF